MAAFRKGQEVDVILHRCGPANAPEVGRIHGLILEEPGIVEEYDVLIHPAEDETDIEWIFEREGSGMTLALCREGPVYVLRNCQPEQLVRHGQDYR